MDDKLIVTEFDNDDDEPQTITYLRCYKRKYTVVRESPEFKITRKFCLLYLSMRFPNRKITKADVHKLHSIFILLWKKCNTYSINNSITVIEYEDYYYNFGVLEKTSSKNAILRKILFSPYLNILNYCRDSSSDQQSIPIIELLDDDSKYWKFLDFWSSIIDHEQIRETLKERGLFDELIDRVFSFMIEENDLEFAMSLIR
jgi:hypothetical protein